MKLRKNRIVCLGVILLLLAVFGVSLATEPDTITWHDGYPDDSDYLYPVNGRSHYWRSISMITAEDLGGSTGDLISIGIYMVSAGEPPLLPFYFDSVAIYAQLTSDTICPINWDVSNATLIRLPGRLASPLSPGWLQILVKNFAYDDTSNLLIYFEGRSISPYFGPSAPLWGTMDMRQKIIADSLAPEGWRYRVPITDNNMLNYQVFGGGDIAYPSNPLFRTSWRPGFYFSFVKTR